MDSLSFGVYRVDVTNDEQILLGFASTRLPGDILLRKHQIPTTVNAVLDCITPSVLWRALITNARRPNGSNAPNGDSRLALPLWLPPSPSPLFGCRHRGVAEGEDYEASGDSA